MTNQPLTADQQTWLIDKFKSSPITGKLVEELERKIARMSEREMQGLVEFVRVEAWQELRQRAMRRGESFPDSPTF